MRIVVFGAGGMIGSRVVREATARGHEVTAVSRDPRKSLLGSHEPLAGGSVVIRPGDASKPQDVTELAHGHDLVITATRPRPGQEIELIHATQGLLDGLTGSETRLLVVGGAASLLLPGRGGLTVLQDPEFPAELRPIAEACDRQYELVRASEVRWTYLSPPAVIEPGTRTGSYRLGADELLTNPVGDSHISAEDFAVALIDEAEHPHHEQSRFTVAY